MSLEEKLIIPHLKNFPGNHEMLTGFIQLYTSNVFNNPDEQCGEYIYLLYDGYLGDTNYYNRHQAFALLGIESRFRHIDGKGRIVYRFKASECKMFERWKTGWLPDTPDVLLKVLQFWECEDKEVNSYCSNTLSATLKFPSRALPKFDEEDDLRWVQKNTDYVGITIPM